LQCVAVCYSVLQCVAVSCSVLQCLTYRDVYQDVIESCGADGVWQREMFVTPLPVSFHSSVHVQKKPYIHTHKSPAYTLKRTSFLVPSRVNFQSSVQMSKNPDINSKKPRKHTQKSLVRGTFTRQFPLFVTYVK